MTRSARPFGLSTGGYDRRILSDRRGVDRRGNDVVDVPQERRRGKDRRSPRGRRIAEWFPVKPASTLRLMKNDEDAEATTPKPDEDRTSPPPVPVDVDQRDERQTFIHRGRRYEIDIEDTVDARGHSTGSRWLVKAEGVVEFTLRVLTREDTDSVVQRAIQAIENTSIGAERELDFQFAGRRYHLEDWSNAVTEGGSRDTCMWCVTCDGVVEGSFASPRDEAESVLRYRAVEIVRRGSDVRTIGKGKRDDRKSRTSSVRVNEEGQKSSSAIMFVWIAAGLLAARFISGVVQSMLFGG